MSRQGRHGEAKFTEMCQAPDAVADAVVNRAADDMHGWDHVIDIEPPKNSHLPADLQSLLVQCFAQIKTTNCLKPTTKLKLTNAIKAAKSPLPSFVFLFHYSANNSTPILYGRHIWESEIARFLKRARETEISGRSDLHKLSVSLSFLDEDRIDQNPVDWILNVLGGVEGKDYAANKAHLIDSVGYEEFTHEGTFVFSSENVVGDIVSHELGLSPDLPVSDFKLFDKRFGIKSAQPTSESTEGRVSFSREGKPATLQLIAHDGASFDIPALVWLPTAVGLDHPECRVRIKAGHINILARLNFATQSIDLSCDTTTPLPLLEQLGLLCLLNWSQKGAVEYRIQSEFGQLFAGEFNGSSSADFRMIKMEKVGHHIVQLLGKERCGETLLSMVELQKMTPAMYLAASLFTARSFRFGAVFDNTIDPFEKIAGYSYGEVGPWTFGAIYEAEQKVRSHDGARQLFEFHNPRLVSSFAYKQSMAATKSQIEREFAKYIDSRDFPVATLQDGYIGNWAEALNCDGVMEISVA